MRAGGEASVNESNDGVDVESSIGYMMGGVRDNEFVTVMRRMETDNDRSDVNVV